MLRVFEKPPACSFFVFLLHLGLDPQLIFNSTYRPAEYSTPSELTHLVNSLSILHLEGDIFDTVAMEGNVLIDLATSVRLVARCENESDLHTTHNTTQSLRRGSGVQVGEWENPTLPIRQYVSLDNTTCYTSIYNMRGHNTSWLFTTKSSNKMG